MQGWKKSFQIWHTFAST